MRIKASRTITHPVYAALDLPLFAYGGKREGK
jgi:hypothetical protein